MSLHIIIVSQNALNGNSPKGLAEIETRTMGHQTIFDYRAFLSMKSAGFPGRKKFVFVEDASCLRKQHPDTTFFTSTTDVVDLGKNENVFVVGERSIHPDFLRLANIIHVASVSTTIPGKNTSFPGIDDSEWDLRSELSFSSDPKNLHPFKWQTYVLRT